MIADDSGQSLGLFALFTVAVLMVTGVVGFLALLTSWWVMGVVFGVHVLFTAIVGTAVFSVLSTDNPGSKATTSCSSGKARVPRSRFSRGPGQARLRRS